MDRQTAAELLQRYREGRCTEEEIALLHRWYAEEAARRLDGSMAADSVQEEQLLAEERLLWQRIQSTVAENPNPTTRKAGIARLTDLVRKTSPARMADMSRLRRWMPYVAAATLVVALGTIWLLNDRQQAPDTTETLISDVEPGGYRATLTLANGKAIELSADRTGIIIDDEQIAYRDDRSTITSLDGSVPAEAVQELILSTPKGGTYSVTLPDGTEVWLNAASTLKYPSRFEGRVREVEITGEAYFVVAKDPDHPFRVISSSQTVEVLGTEFNVSAYPDEPDTKTTLVEGKVRLSLNARPRNAVSSDAHYLDLSPAEQAVVRNGTLSKAEVDITQHVAWRNGLIVLDHANLSQIFRRLERWYDVEFVVPDSVPATVQLSGKLPRNSNLSGIVRALQLNTKLNFEIKGRRVMVTN